MYGRIAEIKNQPEQHTPGRTSPAGVLKNERRKSMRKEEHMNGLNKKEIDKIYPILLQKVQESGLFGEIDTSEPLKLKIGWHTLFQGFFEIKRIGKDCYDLTLIF